MASRLSRMPWVAPVWNLPRPLLRPLFKTAAPANWRRYQKMRVDPASTQDSNSMVPFDAHRCIFVHIPKTAGISVARSLFGCLGGGHLPLRIYELVFSPSEFDSYFKFCFVRNPWDRVFSAFTYLSTGGGHAGDSRWAEKHLKHYADFGSFVRSWLTPENIYTEKHFIPQHEFICLRGHLAVDFVGYYERVAEDFATVCRQLEGNATLDWLNRTPREVSDYRAHYTKDMRSIVADIYQRDIELLGYDFDSTNIRGFATKPGLTKTLQSAAARSRL